MIRSIRLCRINGSAAGEAAQMQIELVADATGNIKVESQPSGHNEVLLAVAVSDERHTVSNEIHGNRLPVENVAYDASNVADRDLIRVRHDLYGFVGQSYSSLF
jgi:hypothetical protein